MAEHNQFGKYGEDVAVDYLVSKGYLIRHRNWRSGHKELDIVAEKAGELVIVEVKSRRDTQFALPQDAVDGRKIRRIVAASDVYIKLFELDLPVRFDIITVTGLRQNRKVEHIKNAFYPPVW